MIIMMTSNRLSTWAAAQVTARKDPSGPASLTYSIMCLVIRARRSASAQNACALDTSILLIGKGARFGKSILTASNLST